MNFYSTIIFIRNTKVFNFFFKFSLHFFGLTFTNCFNLTFLSFTQPIKTFSCIIFKSVICFCKLNNSFGTFRGSTFLNFSFID